jgi:hypothetical protein
VIEKPLPSWASRVTHGGIRPRDGHRTSDRLPRHSIMLRRITIPLAHQTDEVRWQKGRGSPAERFGDGTYLPASTELRPPGMCRYRVDAATFNRFATSSTVMSGSPSRALA